MKKIFKVGAVVPVVEGVCGTSQKYSPCFEWLKPVWLERLSVLYDPWRIVQYQVSRPSLRERPLTRREDLTK